MQYEGDARIEKKGGMDAEMEIVNDVWWMKKVGTGPDETSSSEPVKAEQKQNRLK